MRASSVKRSLAFFFLAALSFVLWGITPTPSNSSLFTLAMGLMGEGRSDEAITEFKRFLFLYPETPEAWRACERIGGCYRNEWRFSEALAWYGKAMERAPGEPERVELEICMALAELAEGSYAAAEFRLLSLRAFAEPAALSGRDYLYLGMVYLFSGREKDADRELSAYEIQLSSDKRKAFASMLSEFRGGWHPSPSVALLLSSILPGSGQVYNGMVLDGLNAFFVNGASATLTLCLMASENYAGALFIFLSIFKRYYVGNLRNAESQAIEINERRSKRLAERLASLLLADASVP
jgi:tetratricopeptide (TPR) repeat protein